MPMIINIKNITSVQNYNHVQIDFEIYAQTLKIGEGVLCKIPLSLINELKEMNESYLIQQLSEKFDIQGSEARGLAEFFDKELNINKDILYIKYINLGNYKGRGLGKQILAYVEKEYKDCAIILFAEPMPSTIGNPTDKLALSSARDKLKKFYISNGYREVCRQVFCKNI